jgi:hypothetical protein
VEAYQRPQEGDTKDLSLDDDVKRDRERATEAPEHVLTTAQTKLSVQEKFIGIKRTSLSNPKNPT